MDDRIREAVGQDVPRIVEMGARSLAEGPYRDQIGDPVNAAQLAFDVINSQDGHILLYEKDGVTVALLAFVLFPHYFSGERTAGEVMWFVEPEHRQSFVGLALLRAAERIARAQGAKRMQFTAPTAAVGHAYEALGYQQIEVSYQKELA